MKLCQMFGYRSLACTLSNWETLFEKHNLQTHNSNFLKNAFCDAKLQLTQYWIESIGLHELVAQHGGINQTLMHIIGLCVDQRRRQRRIEQMSSRKMQRQSGKHWWWLQRPKPRRQTYWIVKGRVSWSGGSFMLNRWKKTTRI